MWPRDRSHSAADRITADDTLVLERIEDLQCLFHGLLCETNLSLPDSRVKENLQKSASFGSAWFFLLARIQCRPGGTRPIPVAHHRYP